MYLQARATQPGQPGQEEARAMATTTETKRYNGWANYETWIVKLWLDNEETSYRFWGDMAHQLANDPRTLTYINEFM